MEVNHSILKQFIMIFLQIFLLTLFCYGADSKKGPEDQTDDIGNFIYYSKADYPETVTEIEKNMLNETTKILNELTEKAKNKIDFDSGEGFNRLYPHLKLWFDADVKIKLTNAIKEEVLIYDGVNTFLRFIRRVDLCGLLDRFGKEKEESINLILKMVDNAGSKMITKSRENRDPSYLGWLMDLINFIQCLEEEDIAHFDKDKYLQQIIEISHFDIKIKSKISYKSKKNDSITHCIAEGKGFIQLKDNFTFYGEGKVTVLEFYNGYEVLKVTNGPEVHQFIIKELPLKSSRDKKKECMIPFNFIVSNYVTYEGKYGTLVDWTAWDFMGLHLDETFDKLEWSYMIANQDHGTIVKIKDWEIVNNGKVYLRKVYQRSLKYPKIEGIPDILHAESLTYTEDTIIEILFTPK